MDEEIIKLIKAKAFRGGFICGFLCFAAGVIFTPVTWFYLFPDKAEAYFNYRATEASRALEEAKNNHNKYAGNDTSNNSISSPLGKTKIISEVDIDSINHKKQF